MRTSMYFHRIESDAENCEWKALARKPSIADVDFISYKASAIRAFRRETGAGLKEAKDTVEEYLDRLADPNRGRIGPDAAVVPARIVTFPGGHFEISEGIRGGVFNIKKVVVTELAYNVRECDLLQAMADFTRQHISEG